MFKLKTKTHLLQLYVSCRLLGNHKYKLLKKFDNNVSKVECSRCKKQFGINYDVRSVLPWDKELEDMMNICYPTNGN